VEYRHTFQIGAAAIAAAVTLAITTPTMAQSAYEKALQQITEKTGLKPITIPDTEGAYMGKIHRGYEVVYTAKAGDVWGRYVARLTMGELGREAGGVLAYLTGQREHLGGNVVGSPLDQLLSRQIGQPLSVTIMLKHGKPNAPRLDVLSDYAKVEPADKVPQREKVGFNAGYLYAQDAEFSKRVAANAPLMKRMKNLRSQYIRLDPDVVTLFWAGSETDYSGMIRDHGDYYRMINDLMDDLADIADAIPAGK
jgi:hypothetical protein